jgi:protein farnesyltransferase subunit beta
MGRTNKLVDGCYSFWQGGLFSLLQRMAPELLRQTGNPYPLSNTLSPMVVPSFPSEHPVDLAKQAEQASSKAQVIFPLNE